MGQILTRLLCTSVSLLAISSCTEKPRATPKDAALQIKVEPTPDAFSAVELGPYAALPAFVDGAQRCGLNVSTKETIERPLHFQRLSQGPSLIDEEERRLCSGAPAWCALFGPSQADRENERLREHVEKVSQDSADQAERLRRRLEQLQASVVAERRRHAAELERVAKTLAGQGIYLTNDESMSLASPQRLIWAIDHHAPLLASEIRPHEFLNYFDFHTAPIPENKTFSVLPDLAQHPARDQEVTLAISVKARAPTPSERTPANLAYVVDRSASMSAPGHFDFAKRGIARSFDELKPGDIVHLVLFDETTCELARNFVVGRDSMTRLKQLVAMIASKKGSNLADGLARGYAAVNHVYQPDYSNRVILLSDVQASEAPNEEEAMALSSGGYDARRIHLSAVGLGAQVNDRLLDKLTERGRGASVFLSSEEEVDAVFGHRFAALIQNAANDVHFRLQLPPSLRLRAFYGEEASETRGRVQAMHYAAGTTQMYLANLRLLDASLPTDECISLTIEYDDVNSGRAQSDEYSWSLAELGVTSQGQAKQIAGYNLTKARMVATFAHQLRGLVSRYPDPAKHPNGSAAQDCRRTQSQLDTFQAALGDEPEARRLAELWRSYCERFMPELQQVQVAHLDGVPNSHNSRNQLSPQSTSAVHNDFAPLDEEF